MKLKSMFGAGLAALLVGGAAFVTACTVTSEEPPVRPEEPQFCTREYRPVCAQRGSRTQTFANSCLAEVEGFFLTHEGPCAAAGEAACTKEYKPVCGELNGERQTFGNACEARVAGWAILAKGTCSAPHS